MELGFVVGAIRRYAFVVVACTVIGTLLGIAVSPGANDVYQARAVMTVLPSQEAGTPVAYSDNNERYITGQVAVMRSPLLAERVASSLTDGPTGDDVARLATFERVPGTDIVEIVVTSTDPEHAAEVANTYATEYLASLEEELVSGPSAESDGLDAQLSELRTRIGDVDARIEQAMEPFLPSDLSPTSANYPPLPTVEQVVPGLVSEKSLLLTEYNQVLAARTEIGSGTRFEVASRLVQPATVPKFPQVSAKPELIIAGMVAGSFLGVLAAVIFARLTPRLLSIDHAEQLSGISGIRMLPRVRPSKADPSALITDLPRELVPAVDSLCVRAESGQFGESFSVVVAGIRRPAGTTTLAVAMATHYATLGLRVLLVDGDQRNPQISRTVAPNSLGISALLREASKEGMPIDPQRIRQFFSSTSRQGLEVLGVGDLTDEHALRRKSASSLLQVLSRSADVTVIDAGSLLASSASVQLAYSADAVVLAIPRVANASSLEIALAQLEGFQGTLLGSWTPMSSSVISRIFGRRRTLDRPTSANAVAAPEPDEQLVTETAPNDDDLLVRNSGSGSVRPSS